MSAATMLSGINGVAVTLFDDACGIDWASTEGHLAWLDGLGLANVVVGGNTGEFSSLSQPELRQLYGVAGESITRTPLVCGIGGAVDDALALVRSAQEAGAALVMLHEPVDPFVSRQGLINYFWSIARQAGLPVVLYARSSRLANEVLVESLQIDGIVGVKDARADLPSFVRLVDSCDAPIVCGSAELWAPFFFGAGAVGFTSGLVNVAPHLSGRFWDALRTGDDTELWRLWRLIEPFETLRARNGSSGNVAAVKEAMGQLRASPSQVRPPAARFGDLEREEIARIVNSWQEAGVLYPREARLRTDGDRQ